MHQGCCINNWITQFELKSECEVELIKVNRIMRQQLHFRSYIQEVFSLFPICHL